MHDDLARIAVGLPVACLWPLTVPYLAKSQLRVGSATAISALYVLAPQIPSASSFLLLFASAIIPLALRPSDQDEAELATISWQHRLSEYSPIMGALILGLVATVLIDFDGAKGALAEVVDSDRVAIAGTGLVATVFLGGEVVARILKPFTHALGETEETEKVQSLAYAGRYIGWFERAVLFAFVIGGEPEAAAIALAAKSFARFPALSDRHKGFAEYFLIGSLASIALAVAVAAATRAALGIGPF